MIKKYFNDLKYDFTDWKDNCSLFSKHNFKLLVIVCLIILFAYSSLIRANYNYVDDIGRNLTGSVEWGFNFARWMINIFNIGLQENRSMVDMSPYIQYVAFFFIGVSVLITSFIFSMEYEFESIRYKTLAASFLIALNPYFLECLSYKYESVGMAFSVMISILPFLFLRYKKLFSISSIICLILMCLSYQASSGIYILFVLFCGYIMYSTDKITFKEYFIFCLKSALLYIIALGLYYISFVPFVFNSYRSTEIAFSNLIPTVINNTANYFSDVSHDFNIYWKIVIGAVLLSCILIGFISEKKNRVAKTFVLIVVIILASILSYGSYLALVQYANSARMIYGIGIFIALAGILSSLYNEKYSRILFLPCILLLMSFLSYSFAYGNALVAQDEYEKSIEQMVLADINTLDNEKKEYNIAILQSGNPYAPVVQHVAYVYPITTRLVPAMLTGVWWWGGYHLSAYNGYNKLPENFSADLADYELVFDRIKYEIYKLDSNLVIKFDF